MAYTGNATAGADVPNWKTRLAAELRRDKRKTAVLGVLVVVAVVLAGRMLLKPSAPQSARAGAVAAPGSAAPETAGADLVGERSRQTARRDEYLKNIDRTITRDLFAPDAAIFPKRVEPAAPQVTVEPSTQPAGLDAEAKRRLIRAQARGLALESTMVSENPTAIINGRVLRVGEWINGFEVVEITPRSCLLRKEGVDVRLSMQD